MPGLESADHREDYAIHKETKGLSCIYLPTVESQPIPWKGFEFRFVTKPPETSVRWMLHNPGFNYSGQLRDLSRIKVQSTLAHHSQDTIDTRNPPWQYIRRPIFSNLCRIFVVACFCVLVVQKSKNVVLRRNISIHGEPQQTSGIPHGFPGIRSVILRFEGEDDDGDVLGTPNDIRSVQFIHLIILKIICEYLFIDLKFYFILFLFDR